MCIFKKSLILLILSFSVNLVPTTVSRLIRKTARNRSQASLQAVVIIRIHQILGLVVFTSYTKRGIYFT
jgi:hypothetical protein